ncbi:MAG: hypothetical protein WA894_01195, partial [Candidatus Acidiferrum sp.]
GADIGMVQRGGGLRFTLETRKRLTILSYFTRQEFHGDESVESEVFGFVDHTHAAVAKLLDDTVMRDGLADHSGQYVPGVV